MNVPCRDGPIIVSVVIPCLNEGDTISTCVAKALEGLQLAGVAGEVLVADNGSTDDSRSLASAAGATVVPVEARGYGSALLGGIRAAKGKWVVMGDADDSYDFREIPRFVAVLEKGVELVQGCRLPSGGGIIVPGAMPVLHRWVGNPVFSSLVRLWFHAPIHDVYCGLRAFEQSLIGRLGLQCTGMEFATEMIIKASVYGARIAELPITLHVDGRKQGQRHLRTMRDGWRTLRLFLLFTPRWLFVVPGLALCIGGLVAYCLVFADVHVGPARLGVHTLLVGSLAILVGAQTVLLGLLARLFAGYEGILPAQRRLHELESRRTLEVALALGSLAVLGGLAVIAFVALEWINAGFGDLDYASTMRWVIPGVSAVALGIQLVFSAFFMSLLTLRRR